MKQNKVCGCLKWIKKLQTLDSSYLRGKSHFEDAGALSYSMIEPINRYFKRTIGNSNGEYIYFWKSKGLSDERVNLLLHLIIVSLLH